MRVIAGSARSIPLIAPQGYETRPTSDKIKETLFNMINFDLPGCTFIDLFSGSGAIGIEALSRGAKHAYFVESSKKAVECIKANVTKCKFTDEATIIARDVFDACYSIHDKADIIFMDPPYDMNREADIMEMLKNTDVYHKDTLFIIESNLDKDLSNLSDLGFSIVKEKKYKNNKHTFLNIS